MVLSVQCLRASVHLSVACNVDEPEYIHCKIISAVVGLQFSAGKFIKGPLCGRGCAHGFRIFAN